MNDVLGKPALAKPLTGEALRLRSADDLRGSLGPPESVEVHRASLQDYVTESESVIKKLRAAVNDAIGMLGSERRTATGRQAMNALIAARDETS